jgi:F-type H+-transporting ATPase subunit b
LNFAARRAIGLAVFAVWLAGLPGPAAARALGGGIGCANAVEGDAEGTGERRELLFKVINFVILAGGLAYVLRKPLKDFFSTRSDSIRKSLEEGRKVLEASHLQLQAVEEKLRHLEEEIAAFQASAAKETQAERERLRRAAAEEAEKVLESARARIETAVRAAMLELKSYTGTKAVELAGALIERRLDDSSRKHLVSQFVASLEVKDRKN